MTFYKIYAIIKVNKIENKEYFMHWSEELAQKIIKRNPDKEEYVCAAGVSPSGSVHI